MGCRRQIASICKRIKWVSAARKAAAFIMESPIGSLRRRLPPRRRAAVAGRGLDFIRSVQLTIFWRCGCCRFSSRNVAGRGPGNHPSTVLAEDFVVAPRVWHADSQREDWNRGWRGLADARDFGCVPAHPASWRASASYLPLRADWAVCAWALRGCARSVKPFSARNERRAS